MYAVIDHQGFIDLLTPNWVVAVLHQQEMDHYSYWDARIVWID